MILTAILYALAAVESGGNPKAIGRAGERSQYQITEAAWREEVDIPFEKATEDPQVAYWVAIWRVRRIVRDLEHRHAAVTPQAIAHAWNPGAPPDYAERVANLYFDFIQP